MAACKLRRIFLLGLGVFTTTVEFDQPPKEKLVETIAATEKEGTRTFEPSDQWKYN